MHRAACHVKSGSLAFSSHTLWDMCYTFNINVSDVEGVMISPQYKKLKILYASICGMKIICLDMWEWLIPYFCYLQMERQMSMGSNMMGMQSPAHSSSCSSTHIPSMHSEAKLVSICKHSHGCIHTQIHKRTLTCVATFFSTELCQQSCALRPVWISSFGV